MSPTITTLVMIKAHGAMDKSCEYVEVLEVPRVPTVGARTVSRFKPQRFLLSHQGESTTNTSTREGVLARVLAS